MIILRIVLEVSFVLIFYSFFIDVFVLGRVRYRVVESLVV